MTKDRCVCCGEIIPEGRMVCPRCEKTVANYESLYVLPARQFGKVNLMRVVEKWKKLSESSMEQN